MEGDRALAFAAVDFLCCLILVALVLIAPIQQKSKPAIETLGRYSIDMTWPGQLDQDMDLWCQDPNGNLVWFETRDAGYMSLTHDDLGTFNDPSGINHERVILRWAVKGEYICNVQVYRKNGTVPTPVVVTLTQLAGQDRQLYKRTIEMRGQGDEQTAFRFTLDRNGIFTGTSTLFKALATTGTSYP